MKKLIAMAVPVAPGKTEAWKSFMGELHAKYKADFDASRKKMGVRERTFLQNTPMGDLVLVTLEGEDPAKAFSQFAAGEDAFTKWFVSKVNEIHGIDLKAMSAGGNMPEMVVDSGE